MRVSSSSISTLFLQYLLLVLQIDGKIMPLQLILSIFQNSLRQLRRELLARHLGNVGRELLLLVHFLLLALLLPLLPPVLHELLREVFVEGLPEADR